MAKKNNKPISETRPTLLDRPHPQGYSHEWMESLKGDPTKQEHDGTSVLTFRLNDEYLAIKTKSIQEIREYSLIHKIPHKTNEVLLGVTNIQGELKLTVSLNALLGFEKNTKPSQTSKVYPRILSLGSNKNDFVFVVDEVYGIAHVETEKLKNTEPMARFSLGTFSLKDKIVTLLEGQEIIDCINKNYL